MNLVRILSGGAAAAVVKGVQARFEQETGARIEATFSAVGQMRDQLVAGAISQAAVGTRHQGVAVGRADKADRGQPGPGGRGQAGQHDHNGYNGRKNRAMNKET